METLIGQGAPAAGLAGDLIKDSTTATFMQDVVAASEDVPVIVDFWAPWCGPCKQLGPMLEKNVLARKGAVKMVKVDIDKSPDIAQQMRIQSIPAVYAFYQGRPVDGFMGAVPESEVKAFIDRLVQMGGGESGPSPIDQALEQAAELMAAGDFQTAGALYSRVLEHEPENTPALAGLARALMETGEMEAAQEVIGNATDEQKKAAEIQAVVKALQLAAEAAKAGDLGELMETVAKDHNNHQARYDLALALYAHNKPAAAADELLEIIRRKRDWNEDQARRKLVEFFEAWGPTHELTVQTRRKLSSVLFS